MSRGQYPRVSVEGMGKSRMYQVLISLQSKADEVRITETIKVSVDESPVQLCFWDIRGIDYDPSWLHGAHVALVCFSVNIGSTDSKGKHLGRVSILPLLILSRVLFQTLASNKAVSL